LNVFEFKNMTSVIVTGATGFVGTHLVKKLKTTGHQIIGLNSNSGDIADKATWDKLPKADIVIHLAARSIIAESWVDVSGFMECNLMGTVEVLNYCRTHGSHLIYISSYLYGNPEQLPVPETAELSVNNPYAFTKKLAEETCQFYAENFDFRVTVLRPFNVYGPGQSENFIVPALIAQVATGEAIRVKDLELKRDYLYINDLVQAIVLAIDCKEKYAVFNIGSGKSYSGKELIEIIQKHEGTDLPVYSKSERRKNEIMNTIADIRNAKEQLSWEPQWTLSEGIKDMLSIKE
jgi:nucleoside-diphosphate-sugar epimerase